MDKSDLRDLAVEGRNKYGVWNDDLDELATRLSGGEPIILPNSVRDIPMEDADSVDESFWRATRDSSTKYGR